MPCPPRIEAEHELFEIVLGSVVDAQQSSELMCPFFALNCAGRARRQAKSGMAEKAYARASGQGA